MKKILFGSHLRYTRKKANLSQEELAELLKCEPSTISRWENGLEFPRIKHFQKVQSTLESLGICYDEFQEEDRKEFLKVQEELLVLIHDGRAEEIDEAIRKFEKFMDESNAEHRQYRGLANLMYLRKRGMSIKDFLERSTEIFELSKQMPSIDDIENIMLTRIEHMIIYKMGMAYIYEGKIIKGERILLALLKNGLKRQGRYFKKISISVSTSLVKTFIKRDKLKEAHECIKYCFEKGTESLDFRNLYNLVFEYENYCKATDDTEGQLIVQEFLIASKKMLGHIHKKKH